MAASIFRRAGGAGLDAKTLPPSAAVFCSRWHTPFTKIIGAMQFARICGEPELRERFGSEAAADRRAEAIERRQQALSFLLAEKFCALRMQVAKGAEKRETRQSAGVALSPALTGNSARNHLNSAQLCWPVAADRALDVEADL